MQRIKRYRYIFLVVAIIALGTAIFATTRNTPANVPTASVEEPTATAKFTPKVIQKEGYSYFIDEQGNYNYLLDLSYVKTPRPYKSTVFILSKD